MSGTTRSRFVAQAAVALAGLGAGGALPSPARAATPRTPACELDGEVAASWLQLELELIRGTAGFSPPVAARALGYSGMALYEAVVAGMPRHRSLAGSIPTLPRPPRPGGSIEWRLAASSALAAAARSLFPTAPAELRAAVDSLERRWSSRLRSGLTARVAARSVAHGRTAAAGVLMWARSDGGNEAFRQPFPPYDPPRGAGLWQPTPQGYLRPLQPYWGTHRCLALPQAAAAGAGDHPPYSDRPGSRFRAELDEVVEAAARLTPEQARIARFWSDDPGATATPPGHSISIATQVLRRERADLALAAETYARVGIALADAFVACWHEKYRYSLARPVTLARAWLDPDWLPLLETPPFPEYPSGHSVQSAAAAEVLTRLFGADYAFTDRTHESRGLPPRRFASFAEAAEEAALSRLYGGIHFRAAIANGLVQGARIGRAAASLPLREPATR